MMHRNAGSRNAKRVVMSLLASVCLIVGSPVAASSASNAGGAQKPVSATHGDCKNDNAGKHNGYVCPSDDGSDNGNDDGGVTIFAF
jgi:hypothetical protein